MLLKKKKSLAWILIGCATPLILGGCALGLSSGIVTILVRRVVPHYRLVWRPVLTLLPNSLGLSLLEELEYVP